MKIVIKEWTKDKWSCCLLIISALLSVICIWIDTRLTLMISQIIVDPGTRFRDYMISILTISICQVILNTSKSYTRSVSIHRQYTKITNRWGNKILDADIQMFTKYSVAYISTVSECIWRIVNIGLISSTFIISIINIGILLYSIYNVANFLIIPVSIIYSIAFLIFWVLFKKFIKWDNQADQYKASRNLKTENAIIGFLEIRSFNMVESSRESIIEDNEMAFQLFKKRSVVDAWLDGSIELAGSCGVIAVVIYSVKQLSAGIIDQVQGMSSVMYVTKLVNPLLQMIDFISSMSKNLSMIDDYEKIINYANRTNNNGYLEIYEFKDEIDMKNVSFSYDTTDSALVDINMTIKRGQKIGICGESGAGKSTLFKLLNKFYDPDSGIITIDGFDIKNITNESYRDLIGCVHQDNVIFSGTIRDNIMFGSDGVSEFEIIEASKKAKIYDFIVSKKDGFNTKVGSRGLDLSGGQKQRIALARLFLKNPEIILLDEATSALDNESENFIQDAIDQLQNKTIVTIAHRLTTIRNSDVIYVMGNNTILEKGSHEELMDLKGVYYKMVTAKSRV